MAELTINTNDIVSALRKHLEGFDPAVETKTVGRVLEVGSVPCHFTLLLKRLGYDVAGTDLAPERVSRFLERHDLRDDRLPERALARQARDVSVGRFLLLITGVENRRPILRTDVRSLPVQLRRIVGDREKDLQQALVRHLLGIVRDLDRFGVAGRVLTMAS